MFEISFRIFETSRDTFDISLDNFKEEGIKEEELRQVGEAEWERWKKGEKEEALCN